MSLDLARCSQRELERAVGGRCSRFGTVIAVKVFPPGEYDRFTAEWVAAVLMSTPVEAAAVVAVLGTAKFNSAAFIRLEHRKEFDAEP